MDRNNISCCYKVKPQFSQLPLTPNGNMAIHGSSAVFKCCRDKIDTILLTLFLCCGNNWQCYFHCAQATYIYSNDGIYQTCPLDTRKHRKRFPYSARLNCPRAMRNIGHLRPINGTQIIILSTERCKVGEIFPLNVIFRYAETDVLCRD